MISDIQKLASKGYYWIPAENDKRGRPIPFESFLEMKRVLEPQRDDHHVGVTLMHVDAVIEKLRKGL